MSDKKRENKQHKKYRPVKCEDRECHGTIDVDYALKNEDFDYVDGTKSSIYVYCPICGLQHTVKL